MNSEYKEKLIQIGAEKLAESLLELSVYSEQAEELIERLVAAPEENVKRFRRKLAGIKRSKKFYHRSNADTLARKLEWILAELKAGVDSPLQGLQCIAQFYKCDAIIFEMCDDSNGCVGSVFDYDARNLFLVYAKQCKNKDEVADIIFDLCCSNDYGARDEVIECAGECLPDALIRRLIAQFQDCAAKKDDEFKRKSYLMNVGTLAKQLKDAELYESTYIETWGGLSTCAFIEIARIYLEREELDFAQSYLNRISKEDTYMANERDSLQSAIYSQKGDDDKLAELLHKKFRKHHSEETLQSLLDVIGHNKREKIIEKEIKVIMNSTQFLSTDVEFLIEIEKNAEAEEYIIKHAEEIDGDRYMSLIRVAKMLATRKSYLAASLIYRKLLTSILERGYTKAYKHGVRYLKKLDTLSENITDWRHFKNHKNFKDELYQEQKAKWSFWEQYDGRRR